MQGNNSGMLNSTKKRLKKTTAGLFTENRKLIVIENCLQTIACFIVKLPAKITIKKL